MFFNRVLFLCLFFVFCAGLASANKVLFARNDSLGKIYLLAPGADVRFSFSGYLGQSGEFRGRIITINDSGLTLAGGSWKKKDTLQLLLKDITGFRAYSNGKMLAKSAMQIALFTGSVVLATAVLAPTPMAPIAKAGISVGVAFFSYHAVKWTFPDRVKYTVDTGWEFSIAEAKSLK